MIRVKRETRQSVKKAEEKKNLPWKILDYFVKIIGSSLILFFSFSYWLYDQNDDTLIQLFFGKVVI